jgi:formylglycine-generating enzyme required for sulfatase activity
MKHRLLNFFGFTLFGLILAGCNGSASTPGAGPVSTATPASTPVAGQTRIDARGIEQVWVPAGSFQMGADAVEIAELTKLNPPAFVLGEFKIEQPKHEVRLTRGYWIDKTEVTNAAFQVFVDDGGYTRQELWSEAGWAWVSKKAAGSLPRFCTNKEPDFPRVCVTWFEAEAYARWRGGRLPSEAEWEYAARGPQSPVYPWGNEFDPALCNVVDAKGTLPVGSFPGGASWVGALDMAGNAMEWVNDWLGFDYYAASPLENPAGPETGTIKVEKGGWWGATQFVARASYRHFEDKPDYGDYHIGFRIVSDQ